jgi:hypothetical protein
MRYCALIADSTDALTHYGTGPNSTLNLSYMGLPNGVHRTPDAALYALALFIHSLQPPANPNPLDDLAKHGEKIFAREGCARCHTPPLYTNNKLTLAEGFHPSPELAKDIDYMSVSVDTDPNLALKTRKGTGYYRVPSLRMLWLQACFLHDCAIGSLEEMFNSARLTPDFRSSNWSSLTPSHPVKGHIYGLDLSPEDRAALIAFLRTL